jgi:hypothetical protein
LHQGVEPGTHLGRKAGVDRVATPFVVGAHRRADDAREAVRAGRLDPERAAPGLGFGRDLADVAGPGGNVVPQPGAEVLGVGDARLAEAEQGAYLGTLPLQRAVGGVGQQRRRIARRRHAQCARQLRYRAPVHLGRGAGEAAAGAVEQQHDREAQAAAPALGLDEEAVRRGQLPGGIDHRGAHAGHALRQSWVSSGAG